MAFRPMIDNGLLSPSGRVAKRARQASNERVRRELFGDVMPFHSLPPQPSKRESLLRHAAFLRGLAARGMRPRAHVKEAERLEALAERS